MRKKKMEILKQFRFVILLVLIVLILVLLRSAGAGNFKPGAERLAAASALKTNLVSAGQAEALPGNKLIVLLSEKIQPRKTPKSNQL